MSAYFTIKGLAGKRMLQGDVRIVGAKNAALKAIAASILYKTPLTLTNVPHIEDVSRMLDILREMGAKTTFADHTAVIDVATLASHTLTPEISKRLRASIVLTGPILARHGEVKFPHPGGCVIGERPIDLFLEGYIKMGAIISRVGKFYHIKAPKGGLLGAEIFFRLASVTGTETFMMAAVLAKGTTVIRNAAMEPEIKWLADMLCASGANIEGAGTSTITIRGGATLSCENKKSLKVRDAFRVVPDRIEAGSFLILGALAAKRLTLTHVEPAHLGSLIEILQYSGITLSISGQTITVESPQTNKVLRAVSVRTHEYPGFPTDLQAPLMIYLTQTKGESLVFETIFEGRLNYTESLNRMGANITMMDPHRVLVKGPTKLKGRVLESPDLRAGLAFVIAGAISTGNSEIHNVYNIDRGYESIEDRLRSIGLDIKRHEGV